MMSYGVDALADVSDIRANIAWAGNIPFSAANDDLAPPPRLVGYPMPVDEMLALDRRAEGRAAPFRAALQHAVRSMQQTEDFSDLFGLMLLRANEGFYSRRGGDTRSYYETSCTASEHHPWNHMLTATLIASSSKAEAIRLVLEICSWDDRFDVAEPTVRTPSSPDEVSGHIAAAVATYTANLPARR